MLKHRLKTLRATVSPVIRSQRPPPSWVEWKWVDKNTRMCQIQSNQRRLSATRCIISSSVSRTIDIRREGTPKLEALQNSGPFGNSQSFHHHVEREFASARQGSSYLCGRKPQHRLVGLLQGRCLRKEHPEFIWGGNYSNCRSSERLSFQHYGVCMA